MAIENCGLLTANLGINCDEPMVSGVNDRIWIMNKSEVDSFTYGASKETISAIVLASGKTAFTVNGKNDSVDPKTELAKARFSTNQNHEVIFRVFDNSVAIKTQINKMQNGKFVIVVENNHVNSAADSAFEVYGEIAGLELVESNRMPTDVESEASWLMTFRSPERSKEPRVPATFLDTDYATSLAALDALLV